MVIMERCAFLFAGQGSQYVGMAKDLCEAYPESKQVFDRADKILKFDLSKLCFFGPQEELTKTYNSQPAILTATIAAFEAFRAVTGSSFDKVEYLAGLSLGEYSALVAGGSVSFEDALYLVRKRGEFMEDEALKRPGGMVSLIGLNMEAAKQICERTGMEIANLNCPGQIVVSGAKERIEEAQMLANELGAKMAVPLEVSGAFHSSFMKNASVRLGEELKKIELKLGEVKIISNVSATPYASASQIRENLIKQVYSSVLWEQSMRFILDRKINTFVEFGPGRVLKGLMRRIHPGATVLTVEKKQDLELFREGVTPNGP